MAIFWSPGEVYIKNDGEEYGRWVRVEGPVHATHIGRVVKTYKREFKPMSDIYADKYIAVCLNDDGTTELVEYSTNFELDQKRFNSAQVDEDIDPKLMAQYEALQEIAAERRRRKEEEERKAREAAAIEAEKNRPAKGKRMEVYRGRKVPKGTVGTVFWVRDGRVGLDVTGKKNAKGHVVDPVWVNADYLKAAG